MAAVQVDGGRVAAARTVGEFIHRAEMDRAIGEAILQGVVPTGVLGVAAAGHRAVIPDVRKGIGAAGRIVSEHRIGTESALTTEGQRAEMRGRYAAVEFVVEGLARARAVDRLPNSWPWEGRCWWSWWLTRWRAGRTAD